jgi:hypothetical protein
MQKTQRHQAAETKQTGVRRQIRARKPDEYDNEVHARRDADTATHATSKAAFPAIEPTDLPADIVLPRLRGVSGNRPSWSACCPAHADTRPSLSLTETGDGKLLMNCFAGCKPEAVMQAIGLDLSFLYPSPFAQQFGNRKVHVGSAAPPSVTAAVEPCIDNSHFMSIHRDSRKGCGRQVKALAAKLKLPYEVLERFGVGFLDNRWVLPERDNGGRIVGICYRDKQGQRKCEPRSHRGLTLVNEPVRSGPVYVSEGATDAAALLSVGVNVVGRPMAKASGLIRLWLLRHLSLIDDHGIIVVGDRDPTKNSVSVGKRAARELAEFLRQELGRPVSWALPRPGFKDVRDQITAGQWSQGLQIKEIK